MFVVSSRGYDLSRASACGCCEIAQGVRFITGIVVCVMSDPDHTSQGARFVTGMVARSHITAGTICYWHRRVLVVRSHITGGYDLLRASACVCCEITHHRGHDLLRASACVCCEHMTGGTICYEHRRVHVGVTAPMP